MGLRDWYKSQCFDIFLIYQMQLHEYFDHFVLGRRYSGDVSILQTRLAVFKPLRVS